MCLHNVPALRCVRFAELIAFLGLDLILKELEGPYEPESRGRHEACGEELPLFSIHKTCMSPHQI